MFISKSGTMTKLVTPTSNCNEKLKPAANVFTASTGKLVILVRSVRAHIPPEVQSQHGTNSISVRNLPSTQSKEVQLSSRGCTLTRYLSLSAPLLPGQYILSQDLTPPYSHHPLPWAIARRNEPRPLAGHIFTTIAIHQ